MAEENDFKPRDKITYVGFLILIAWLPLPLGSNRAWAWSIMEVWVYLLSSLWLLAYIFKIVRLTPSFHKARPVIILLCLWLLWIAIQVTPMPTSIVQFLSPHAANIHGLFSETASGFITLSVDPYATRVGLLKSLAYVLIFCLALLLIRNNGRLQQLASVIVYSGLFQATYGILMTLSGLNYGFFIKVDSGHGSVIGTFINRNHLAGYLVMCLAVGIGIMIANLDPYDLYSWRQRVRNILRLLLGLKLRLRLYLVVMVIALVLTHSRMGNTSFFVSLIVAGVIGLFLSRHATRSTIILLVSLIVIDIMIVGGWFGLEKVARRIQETSFITEKRVEVNEYAIQQWQDYKLTGSGLGSFYTVFPKYRKQDITGFYDHAHNDYLQFGTETGVIGIAILGIIVLWSMCVALIAQFKSRDPLMRGISFAVIMSLTAMMIHSTVDFNLQIPSNAATFMIILSMAWISFSLKTKKQHF